MKKHLIGFTVFAFIVGSFAFIWALFGYFTQTIPNVPKVESERLPVFKSEKRRSCSKYKQTLKYDVISSQYFKDEGKLISKLEVDWNGYGSAPDKIYVGTKIFSSIDFDNPRFEDSKVFYTPFGNERSSIIYVETNLRDFSRNNENFYANFNISTNGETNVFGTQTSQIVFVHGNSSILTR